MNQLASEVFVVRPAHFGFNPETAGSNSFQHHGTSPAILEEFDGVHKMLEDSGIKVHVFEDLSSSPDAIFPNNWVSFHPEGAVLYPMLSPARRTERRLEFLQQLNKKVFLDLTQEEQKGRYLEGTGSLVLSRNDRFAFACLSPRTDQMLAFQWCQAMGYRLIDFETTGPDGQPIYHSNVVGAVGEGFAVVCAEAIVDRAILNLFTKLEEFEVIEITMDQMNHFCGNILHLSGDQGPVIAMSEQARDHFTDEQIQQLERHGKIISAPIPNIERIGGGSVRCMIAEIF